MNYAKAKNKRDHARAGVSDRVRELCLVHKDLAGRQTLGLHRGRGQRKVVIIIIVIIRSEQYHHRCDADLPALVIRQP
jgi:hypothetical protein